jgi:putative oligomerization/nucleic acid binding protein
LLGRWSKRLRRYLEESGESTDAEVGPLASRGQQGPAPTESDHIEQLEKLAALKKKGALTEEEFEAEKAKILAR